jgi:hypothetical protein
MFVSPIDAEVRREQYEDLIREAEFERLAQLALGPRPAREPVVQRLGHWAGTLMVRWGCRLATASTLSVCSCS